MMKTTLLYSLNIMLFAACELSGNPVDHKVVSQRQVVNEQNAIMAFTFTVAKQTFRFISSKAKEIITKRGSRFKVPESAFIYKSSGKPVEGEVEVTIHEYNTAGEIIASGIPMVYRDPKGEKEDFESAGMFEIQAYQGEEELEIAENKEIKVELASDIPGKFNIYRMNENCDNWDLLKKDNEPIPNPYIKLEERELEDLIAATPEKPKKPVKYAPGDKLFDIKSYNYYSQELDLLNGVLWKYTGDDPKADPANRVGALDLYKLIYMEPIDTNILLYDLSFEDDMGRNITIPAAPVFQGKLLDKENKRIARVLKELAEILEQQKIVREQLKREKKMLRVFNLDKLGIYNYDRQYKDPEAIQLVADFKFNGKSEEGVSVFLIPAEKRAAIKYIPETYKNFAINPEEHNKLLAILPDETIYYLPNTDILKSLAMNGGKTNKITFDLKLYKIKFENPEQVDELLAGL